MADQQTQNLQNHTRFMPLFHFFAAPVLLINFIYSLVQLRNGLTFASLWNVVFAAALIALALSARLAAISVQDRVIRLEMRLRLAGLLPPDLQPRIAEFTVGQLVALRFAGDDELPALARQVLQDKLDDRKTIKQRIKNWQADFQRA